MHTCHRPPSKLHNAGRHNTFGRIALQRLQVFTGHDTSCKQHVQPNSCGPHCQFVGPHCPGITPLSKGRSRLDCKCNRQPTPQDKQMQVQQHGWQETCHTRTAHNTQHQAVLQHALRTPALHLRAHMHENNLRKRMAGQCLLSMSSMPWTVSSYLAGHSTAWKQVYCHIQELEAKNL